MNIKDNPCPTSQTPDTKPSQRRGLFINRYKEFTRGRILSLSPGPSGEVFRAMASMDWDDYLRQEASMYRQLAEKTEDVFSKQELLDLAAVCEEVANSIEDRLTGW